MKIGTVADTHIPRRAAKLPEKLLDYLKNEKVDMILHAGDLVEMEVLDPLRDIAKTVAVYGNMDSNMVRKFLPEKEIIEAGKFKIGLTHGGGPPFRIKETVRAKFDNVQAIVFGHTHFPVNEVIDGVLYFNPGSVTDKVFADFKSFGILHINDEIKGEIIKL